MKSATTCDGSTISLHGRITFHLYDYPGFPVSFSYGTWMFSFAVQSSCICLELPMRAMIYFFFRVSMTIEDNTTIFIYLGVLIVPHECPTPYSGMTRALLAMFDWLSRITFVLINPIPQLPFLNNNR